MYCTTASLIHLGTVENQVIKYVQRYTVFPVLYDAILTLKMWPETHCASQHWVIFYVIRLLNPQKYLDT